MSDHPAQNQTAAPLRIGVLGTGSIVKGAIVGPARQNGDVVVTAIGSRSIERAAAFGKEHGVERAMSYEQLIDHPDIDVVYIALPPSMHAEWSIRALEHGKHVLCEKPATVNAAQASQVITAVERSGRVYMEACHYVFHPFTKRVRDLLDTNVLGHIRSAEVTMQIPAAFIPPGDSKRNVMLGGGALMDAGCYALRGLRSALGDPVRVLSAEATPDGDDPRLDLAMSVNLEFSEQRQGRFLVSFLGTGAPHVSLRIHGVSGTLLVERFMIPHFGASLTLEWNGRTYVEQADPTPSYVFQLREFVRCVRDGAPVLTTANDSMSLMRVIDDIYAAAGLPVREYFGIRGVSHPIAQQPADLLQATAPEQEGNVS